jgi:hypothetical protein
MAAINNTPPVLGYLLAVALKLSGGSEFVTRALFFPFDLAAGLSLLALASRFLKKPLWPVLIVLAGPAWTLNLHRVMAERVMAGFAFPALWLAVVAADEGDVRAFWGSAAFAAAALLSKYNALFVVPPALFYFHARGVPPRRLAAWTLAAASGVALYQLIVLLHGGAAARAAWTVAAQASGGVWSAPSHKARALLAFTGGLSLVGAVWGLRLSPPRQAVIASVAACAVLFQTQFDLAPIVRPIDRYEGFLFAWGTCVGLWTLIAGPRTRGSALWAPWLAAVAVLQLLYWSIVARFVVFLLPPLTFWLWERLEAERPRELEFLGKGGFAVVLVLTLALGAVDRTYASAQRAAAEKAVALELPRGGTVWYSGHWGLQEYLSASGARQLDADRGGWDETRAGDLVVASAVNTNALPPSSPRLAETFGFSVDSAIPLRLLGRRDDAGFYTSAMGFLPWTFSRAPVDEFTFVELR